MELAERYRLDRLLGRGGMGDVWAGWDTRLGRPVAVKMLAGSAGDEAAARFRREARTAAHIDHPHVVGVHDFGVADDGPYMVMELVAGHSLADELRQYGPRPPARVAAVAAQIADGLAAAHRQGVVHRDIKPSNVLLAGDGSVKIADFGIARDAGGETAADTTRTGMVTGTTLYMSPEAALGSELGPAGDVYSLGCALYELLVGRPPFTAEHPLAVLRQHVECAPAPPRRLRPEVPAALDAFLLRMLAKQPAARPTAEEVKDWFAAGAWRDTVTLPAEEPTPARRTVPALAGATTAVVAVAAAVFALAAPLADGNSPTTQPTPAAPPPQAAAPQRPSASRLPTTASQPTPAPRSTKGTTAAGPHTPHAEHAPASGTAPETLLAATAPAFLPPGHLKHHGHGHRP